MHHRHPRPFCAIWDRSSCTPPFHSYSPLTAIQSVWWGSTTKGNFELGFVFWQKRKITHRLATSEDTHTLHKHGRAERDDFIKHRTTCTTACASRAIRLQWRKQVFFIIILFTIRVIFLMWELKITWTDGHIWWPKCRDRDERFSVVRHNDRDQCRRGWMQWSCHHRRHLLHW